MKDANPIVYPITVVGSRYTQPMELDAWDIDGVWLVSYMRKAVSVSLNELSRKSHGKINHVKKGKDVVVFRLFDKKSLFLRPHSTFSGAFNYISESNYIKNNLMEKS